MEVQGKKELESREYQVELFEIAKDNNMILFLPTGSGKTFIAILLIKHFCNLNEDEVYKSIENGGKRAFFLVNTVALVEQQALQIESQTPFAAGRYSGDMGVDVWSPEIWKNEINTKQVLVMTCQIFVDLIEKKRLSLKNVNLLIFDECHRGVGNHPMRQVMKSFEGVPKAHQPRVLGLTATLLNGNVSPSDVAREIRDLEITFLSQIQTSLNEEMVQMYSTDPKENVVTYDDNDTSGYCYQYCKNVLDNITLILNEVKIDDSNDPPPGTRPSHTYQVDSSYKKTNKRLKNVLADVYKNLEDLGIYGGSLAVLVHLVQLTLMLPHVQLESARIVYQTVTSHCILLRKFLQDTMEKSGKSELEQLRCFSSNKVGKLFGILKKVKSTDSAIVFVDRRFTAKTLHYLLKRASSVDPKLSQIKANFVVGYNVGNPFKDTRENYMQRKQNTKVMRLFNQGEINVLFASNVVEEGIDITKCNFVIQFDLIQDFRAYIQSKGRARDKESHFIMMIPRLKTQDFQSKYSAFKGVEETLKNMLYKGKSRERSAPREEELDLNLFANTPGLEPYRPYGPNGPIVTALSAIPLLNRYFATLETDKFTKVRSFWFMREEKLKYKCFLQLPSDAKEHGLVEGTWQSNKENAKRSVALETCKVLHKAGELDDVNLLPKGIELISETIDFTPNYDKNESFEEIINDKKVMIGSKNHKRLVEKKGADCLMQCGVKPGQPVFLHVLDMRPVDSPPTNPHCVQELHRTLCLPNTFAIISSKRLPKLAAVPLYMSSGELEGRIGEVCHITLHKDQLQLISHFHAFIFEKVLELAKKFMVRDLSNKDNSYLVVPVNKGEGGKIEIDYNVMNCTLSVPFPSVEEPTVEARANLARDFDSYKGKIISPWYRTVPLQLYLVTDVCWDKSEETAFPVPHFKTFKGYFKEKYRIEPVIKSQPLIEVKGLSSRLNSTKPRALSKELRKKKIEELEMLLLPEYCVVFPLPGKYWVKAVLLPSMLYRITELCLAEELRSVLAAQAHVGSVKPPPVWMKLEEDFSLQKKKPSTDQLQTISTPSPLTTPGFWKKEEEPTDVDRNMDTASLLEVLYFEYFNNKPFFESLQGEKKNVTGRLTGGKKVQRTAMVEAPPLPFVKWGKSIGPEQVEVLQALTTAYANDIINCERFETLGDSFLKFAVSASLFETQTHLLEGHLTNIKGIIVGNKNLYFCGRKKNIGSMLQNHQFSPRDDWVPPGFCVPVNYQQLIKTLHYKSSCLYNIEIPENERRSGKLSKMTHDLFQSQLDSAEEALPSQHISFINHNSLADKNIADAVEALLGVYLKSSGVFGALAVMNWFEITDPKLSSYEVLTRPAQTAAMTTKLHELDEHLIQPQLLEDILNYEFRDRSFLLQALTHPSYTKNNITKTYQRLEFLGDSVIDFLITVHIFDKCSTLSPGDLTDLRSALVNNITLACITVRNHFHEYLLHHSSLLAEYIVKFVKHQEDRNHVIDNDVLFLLEEREVNIAEGVDVPKALGDILEALVGAIYLDSGKSLDVTWRVLYNLMRNEIDLFSKDIPKNHVRMLYESNCSPVFSSYKEDNGLVMVAVEISLKGEKHRFCGFGDQKFQAKRAAAKHALRLIHNFSPK